MRLRFFVILFLLLTIALLLLALSNLALGQLLADLLRRAPPPGW